MWCTFQTHFSMGTRHFQNMILKLKQFLSLPSFIWQLIIGVWMFRFYKTILNLKTRLKAQNLKKILIYFHHHLNLFNCCKTKLKIKLMFCRIRLFYRMNFFAEWTFFLTELNFLKGDTNIYFKQITFFEKKKDFIKIIHIFFLKIFFFST